MQVEEEFARSSLTRDALVTIGVFDGVHLGHKALLSSLKELATKQKLATVAVTFSPHPQTILSPGTKPLYLTDTVEKAGLLKKEGIDSIVVLSFTRELADLGAREFLTLLKKHLRMRGLVIGPDFMLGRHGEGNIETLRALGKEMDFTVTVIPPVKINGEVVSSTAIRNALAKCDMDKVRRLVGRPYLLHGRVVHGTGRGTSLGIPTANMELDPAQALPADGVYVTRAYVEGKAYRAVTNIGKSPTFGGGKRTAEVHLLDFKGDLYGRELRVEFVQKLRDEKKFGSPDELMRQIAEDIKRGRAILSEEAKT